MAIKLSCKMFMRHCMILTIAFYFVKEGYFRWVKNQAVADQLILDYAMFNKLISETFGFPAPIPVSIVAEHSLQIVQALIALQVLAATYCGITLGRLRYVLITILLL